MTTPQTQIVNFIKLTKLEKKVLILLSQQRTSSYTYEEFPEGNNAEGIAKLVFGEAVFNRERRGGHYCDDITLCYAAKSSLSRIFQSLFKKGLVAKCKPRRRGGIVTAQDGVDHVIHYYSPNAWKWLQGCWISEHGNILYDKRCCHSLPYKCHQWYMLTPYGKQIVESLKGASP
jgi:hypothetical protein